MDEGVKNMIIDIIVLFMIVALFIFVISPLFYAGIEVWKNRDNAYGQAMGIFIIVALSMPILMGV